MLTSIEVTNYMGESLEMVLSDPEKSGFNITNVTGIGSGKANINMTDIVTIDGSVFNSARSSNRNIVITMKFVKTSTEDSIEAVRLKSYKYFPKKKLVTLIFNIDAYSLRTSGYVENNDPVIFSDAEGTQISIICPDPNFYLKDPSINYFNMIVPLFRFPFRGATYVPGNAMLTDDQNEMILDSNGNQLLDITFEKTDKIVFGLFDLSLYKTLWYGGLEDAGINIHFHFLGKVKNPTLYNVTKSQKMTINSKSLEELTGSGIVAGDDIYICTIKGKKSVQLLRAGQYINIFNCLDRGTDWITLSNGENLLYIAADEGIEDVNLIVTNDVAYEGV